MAIPALSLTPWRALGTDAAATIPPRPTPSRISVAGSGTGDGRRRLSARIASLDALLVGYYEDSKLLFVAKIRNGFTPGAKADIARRFPGLATDRCPFANLPEPKSARRGMALTADAMKRCRWLKPKLVAQLAFTEWTPNGHLRHASFVALRDDKDPREVTREGT